VNVEAVRALVAVAEHGRFAAAADELAVTQQAVSKRIATLERELGVVLLVRSAGPARLTPDGQAFLPHARAVLGAVQAAVESVRQPGRPLRVEVLGRRAATADILIEAHDAHPELSLEMCTLGGAVPATGALVEGRLDAAFFLVRDAALLPAALAHVRVHDEPLQLVVGPRHRLAGSERITFAQLRGLSVWVPGIVPGSEWGEYYAALADAAGLLVDASGPNFGIEHLLGAIADSPGLATFVGPRMRWTWPHGRGLGRVEVHDPTPVYPWSLVWRRDDPRPALATFREAAIHAGRRGAPAGPLWTPEWVRGV
jgi:DNA-binding transcriptional LysR family regulator